MQNSRSYLFVTWEGGGNVPPVLGIARRMVEHGHDVCVLAEPCLRDTVVGFGGRFEAFSRHFDREDCARQDIMGDWQAKTPIGALRHIFDNVVFGPAPIVAEETRRAIERKRPDVVVVDYLLPGALVAAEAAGISRVVLFHSPEYLPGPGKPAAGSGFLPRGDFIGRARDGLFNRILLTLIGSYVPVMNGIRRDYGLPLLKSAEDLVGEYHRADRRLILTSEAFDFPITPPPANVRYVGPVLDDPDWVEAWSDPWTASDERPLVVAGLSTTFQNQAAVLQNIITALGMLQVRGLVTTGPAMNGTPFNVPANVVATSSAPHSRVFPDAAAVITHGGHGTVVRALSCGVPVLCLPMGRDQNDNATRVVARGAGLQLKPSAGPARIAGAVQRLLAQPDYKTNARRLGQAFINDAATGRAIRELESLGTEAATEFIVVRDLLAIAAT